MEQRESMEPTELGKGKFTWSLVWWLQLNGKKKMEITSVSRKLATSIHCQPAMSMELEYECHNNMETLRSSSKLRIEFWYDSVLLQLATEQIKQNANSPENLHINILSCSFVTAEKGVGKNCARFTRSGILLSCKKAQGADRCYPVGRPWGPSPSVTRVRHEGHTIPSERDNWRAHFSAFWSSQELEQESP